MNGPRGSRVPVQPRPGDKICPRCKRTYQEEVIKHDGLHCPMCNALLVVQK